MAEEHVIGLRVSKFERRFSRKGDKHTDWVELYNLTGMDETGTIRASTWHRIEDLRPTEDYLARDHINEDHAIAIVSRWADLEPKYNAWLNDQEMPESGVPLAAWPGLTSAQGDGLRTAGYKTVEEVAAMPDQIVDKIPLPGLRNVRTAAREWLERRPAADQAARIAELEEQIAALRTAGDIAGEPAMEDDEPADEGQRRSRRAKAA